MLRGPPPFTEQELAVVEARRQFTWRIVGVIPTGEIMYEVRNGSDQQLPFLSIGIRGVCILIEIREERPADVEAIRDLNQRAFGQNLEGNIVDALRSNGAALLSLVATLNGRVVGHIIYSPACVGGEVAGAALGPMAVLLEHQRQGIGSKLVEAGNRKLKEAGCPFIVVVGHANYYPRFGFLPASTQGINCEWEVPDDVFMLLVLDQAKMQGVSGLAKYRHEFSRA